MLVHDQTITEQDVIGKPCILLVILFFMINARSVSYGTSMGGPGRL